jgi:hypothetical protein
MDQTKWDSRCYALMRAAREISRELGHHEIICPLHLLLALLTNVRPASMPAAEPDWPAVREFAPPWGDVVVLSPGGQTPTTKRVLLRAIELAAEDGKPVGVEHVWSALQALEPGRLARQIFRVGREHVEGG